jgi:hypothetical protein
MSLTIHPTPMQVELNQAPTDAFAQMHITPPRAPTPMTMYVPVAAAVSPSSASTLAYDFLAASANITTGNSLHLFNAAEAASLKSRWESTASKHNNLPAEAIQVARKATNLFNASVGAQDLQVTRSSVMVTEAE